MKAQEVLGLAEKMLDARIRAIPRQDIPKLVLKDSGKGDEEVQVLLLSDLQVGHKTPTTTAAIIRNRMWRLSERVAKIASIHQQAYPVQRLVVFLLGDTVQNDRIGRVVSLDELEAVVMDQVFDIAVPCISELLIQQLQVFDQVEVWTVDGNHGSLGRFAAVKTNWDNIVYRMCEQRCREYPEIEWHIEKSRFYQKVKIWKWVFLLAHGDQIQMYMQIPTYGITNKLMRWQGSLPGSKFHYACLGHFHTGIMMTWNEIEFFVNGCFVSDDQWVLKKLGLASETVQITFGVHPRKGVTWRYKLRLD